MTILKYSLPWLPVLYPLLMMFETFHCVTTLVKRRYTLVKRRNTLVKRRYTLVKRQYTLVKPRYTFVKRRYTLGRRRYTLIKRTDNEHHTMQILKLLD